MPHKKFHLPKPKKCLETGKTKFKTQQLAGRAMMRIWSHDPSADIHDLHTYLCPSCGGWHVGHKSYFEKSLCGDYEKINVHSV